MSEQTGGLKVRIVIRRESEENSEDHPVHTPARLATEAAGPAQHHFGSPMAPWQTLVGRIPWTTGLGAIVLCAAVLLGLRFVVSTLSADDRPPTIARERLVEPGLVGVGVAAPPEHQTTREDTTPVTAASRSDTEAPEAVEQPPVQDDTIAFNPLASNNVARVLLTSDVEGREPVDTLDGQIVGEAEQATHVFFFTELQGMRGQTVKHRWTHGDKVAAVLRFPVNGDRWRVYSSKNLDKDCVGSWQVVLTDADGRILARETFDYSLKP